MARQPKITIACGRRGTGKSIETIEMIYKYVSGNPAKNIAGRKALIFDVNDEFGTFTFKDGKKHQIKSLRISDIAAFSNQKTPELRRVRNYWDNGKRLTIKDMQQVLSIILENYKDGLLLVEDINKYTSTAFKMDLVGSLATIRQAGIDLVAHYQLIQRAANPTILGMTNYFRLHSTFDSITNPKIKARFGDKVPIMSIAEELVKNRYNTGVESSDGVFYSVYIDMENGKIKGRFTKKEVELAIQNYISNEGNVVDKMLRKKDRNGQLIYKDYKQAYSILEKELFTKYFN
jgi:hypothetical protein